MKATYQSLNGIEAGKAILKRFGEVLLNVPGFKSRLVTFPRIVVEATVRIQCYEREETEVTSLDEFAEALYDQGLEQIQMQPSFDQTFKFGIDETKESADSIRRSTELPVMRPTQTEDG